METLKISSFKYVITNIGGCWTYLHYLFGITSDGSVYMTKDFNEKTLTTNTVITCKQIGKLDNLEVGVKKEKAYGVLDASVLTIHKIKKVFGVSIFALIFRGYDCTYTRPLLYERVASLYNEYQRENE